MNASQLTSKALELEAEGYSATEAFCESASRGSTPAARGFSARLLEAVRRREARAWLSTRAGMQERDDHGRFR